MSLHIVILAAGLGKRMHSTTPKVLHELGGKAILAHVIETALKLNPEQMHVVVGHGSEQIKQAMQAFPINWIMQEQQLGTGHALMQALPHIPAACHVLVLSGDVPLIQFNTLQALVSLAREETSNPCPLHLLVATLDNPFGLGRIIRNENHQICAIVEEKDATEHQRQIQEIYTGICCAESTLLRNLLPQLQTHNAQQEYYLTDIITLAAASRIPIGDLATTNPSETQGINNRLQLQQLERILQQQRATALMLGGVTLADTTRIDIRGELHCGMDVFIDVNNVFNGKVTLGDNAIIGANCVLSNVTIGAQSVILPNSVIEGSQIGDHCQVGPFARLRPGTILGEHCKVGNFVEAKNAVLDAGSKANHLSYLGDVTIGKQVNIGAGTITCNYDGAHKHQTIIEDGVFIGSDTQLVAPVTVGKNATIGAGSTIRTNVPPNELTLTESKQKTVYGWVRPRKNAID